MIIDAVTREKWHILQLKCCDGSHVLFCGHCSVRSAQSVCVATHAGGANLHMPNQVPKVDTLRACI
jgi:hypothetical protein